jgi:hypothetical protein
MKYLPRKMCGAALAALLASDAGSGEHAKTAVEQYQVTADTVRSDVYELLNGMRALSNSVVYVHGHFEACACVQPVKPTRGPQPTPPPPPMDPAAFRLAIKLLQEMDKSLRSGRPLMIYPASQGRPTPSPTAMPH